MYALSSGQLDVSLDLPKARYLLKIKHKIQDGQNKSVFFNDKLLTATRMRKKKVIETDYFYIEPQQIKKTNQLKVKFENVFPSDLDIRLSNFVPLPQEDLSDDLFIIYKGNISQMGLRLKIGVFLLLLCFFSLVSLFLHRKFKKDLFYLNLAVSPFLIFLVVLMVFNVFPLGQYLILMSRFFFWVSFLLSFFIVLAFVVQ
jgi:hypothetical protein